MSAGDLLDRVLKIGRHPLRAAATITAALALVLGFAGQWGVAATILGVIAGLVAGEVMGRSPVRLHVIAMGLAGGLLVGLGLSYRMVDGSLVPSILGAAGALKISTFLAYGVVFFSIPAGLRALTIRFPGWHALELAVITTAFATAFASHRHGTIARPLWLSDWAWRLGFDPAYVLLLLGGLFVGALAILLVMESNQRLTVATAAVLPVLALLVGAFVDVKALQQDADASELAEIKGGPGDPPKPPDPQETQVEVVTDHGELQGDEPTQSSQPSDPQDEGVKGEQSKQDKARPVAVVLLGDDYSPPSGGWYLRQGVDSEYNGFRMVPTTRDDVDRDVLGWFPSRPEPLRELPPEEGRQRVRGSVALLVEHDGPFALESAAVFLPMDNPNPARFVGAYKFQSVAQEFDYDSLVGRVAGNSEWSEEVFDYYTQGPEDPRYAELVDEILATLPESKRDDPFARALAIKVYIDANTKYSTRERHDGVEDPTADYLFGNFIGYCVHTAHAATYLWRAAGIPARIGSGYLVFEADRRGSTLLVRNGDAHAWPELYLEGAGWVVFDISPATNLDDAPLPMDDDLARILGDMAREDPASGDRITDDSNPLTRLLLSASGVMLLIVVLWLIALHYTVKVWRRGRLVAAGARSMPRVGYRSALDVLSEVGWTRQPGETRERFARRVGPFAPAFSDLTTMHVAARMGNPKAPREGRPEHSIRAWRGTLARFRREVRQQVPWWRRLLGLIDPFSFYRSR